MRDLITLAFCSFFLLNSIESFAQNKIHKFGNIPMEDMEMTVYEPDPSAPAVSLLRTGHYRVRDYNFYVHERIKILKQSGKDYGNFTLRARSKGVFKASCFNLENGEIVEYKLKKSEVFEEEITEDLIIYKLFLPNVKVGSVVEIEYYHASLPFEWRFQQDIPNRYNELLVEKSQYYIFDLSHYGSAPLKSLGGYHWVAQDMPAFKTEPRMSSASNFIRKVEFELSEVAIPGIYYKQYSTTWAKVSEYLSKHERFGGLFRQGTGFLNQKADEIRAMEKSEREKALIGYDYIRENMEWNGSDGIWTTPFLRGNFKEKHSGGVADMNLCLVALLKKAGLSASPVVLSTKDNGKLKRYKPTSDKLNYVLCHILLGDEELLLDATAKNTAPGVMHPRLLNGDGWLVDENTGRWVSLEPKRPTVEKSFAQIEFTEDGDCIAQLRKSLITYHYLSWKNRFDGFESEAKYARALQQDFDEVIVGDYSASYDEDKMKVTEKYSLDLTARMEDLGNEVILNPFVFSANIENPFKAEERISPVDLRYKSGITRTILIKLPPGMRASKLPYPTNISMEDGAAQFGFQVSQNESQLTISYQIVFTKSEIPARDYAAFKSFYSLMIDKLNESITLSKT